MRSTLLLLFFCSALVRAQVTGIDSSATVSGSSSAALRRALPTAPDDSLDGVSDRLLPLRSQTNTSSAVWLWDKDSIALIDYHHIGEIAQNHPAATLFSLGNYGQPAWLGMGGSTPLQSSVTINGLSADNLLNTLPDLYRYSTEDASTFTIYPQYQAFWYGGPGDVMVMSVEEKYWDAPRPITRMRHTEAANEYLYTDAMFTLNTGEKDNIYFGLTRSSIGSSSSNNSARYANNRYESWNVRLRYRKKLGDAVSLLTRLQYDEHLTLLNGGIRGTFLSTAPQSYFFENEAEGVFAATAFDPVSAELVNTTMLTEGQHYLAEAGARVQWSEDSAQVTQLRIGFDSDVRRFRDNILALYPEYTNADGILNLTDHWSLFKAVLDHQTSLSWARMELQGMVGRYGAEMGGETLDDADILAHARGKLSLLFGPVSLSGYGRLDQQFGSSTIAFGAGAELPIGQVSLWGGASFSARPRSLVERLYVGQRVSVDGDRTPNLDKSVIGEAGIRLNTDWLTLDLRGFARHQTRYLDIRAAAFTDSYLGRYRLEVTELPGGLQRGLYGGSADARLTVWRFHLDQQGSVVTSDGNVTELLAPPFSYSAELYFRGVLIEGTLDLRAGARFAYADQFTPLLYHPETGLFLRTISNDQAPRTYTDMKRIDIFLFATIKERATLHLVLYNVFDDQYITTEFYPMFDRAFRLGVDWVFFD
ncbi:MAG: hypothetical protein IH600_13425 [Bacteroidetes bacterium]|nr:hypothetical protein [Bacteroidota bacterium]